MKIFPIKPYVKTAVKQRNVVENLNKVAPKGITKSPIRCAKKKDLGENMFLMGMCMASGYATLGYSLSETTDYLSV